MHALQPYDWATANGNTMTGHRPERNTNMNTKLYLNFIEDAVKNDGIQVADTANKLALDAKQITTDQYSAAAQIIVKYYLAQ